MNLFITLLGYGLGLLPSIVTGIQTVAGDQVAGATKRQMAKDALGIALQGAASVLPSGSTNAALAGASGVVAGQIIDASSAERYPHEAVSRRDAAFAGPEPPQPASAHGPYPAGPGNAGRWLRCRRVRRAHAYLGRHKACGWHMKAGTDDLFDIFNERKHITPLEWKASNEKRHAQ